MKNHSIYQGWKELTGKHGTVSFEDEGFRWAVYEHDANGKRVYTRRIDKHSRESNTALYQRYHYLSIGYSEDQIQELLRYAKEHDKEK
jgi:hypothetical protein